MKKTTVIVFAAAGLLSEKIMSALDHDCNLTLSDTFYGFDHLFSDFCQGVVMDLKFLEVFHETLPELSIGYYISKINVPLEVVSTEVTPIDIRKKCQSFSSFPAGVLYRKVSLDNFDSENFSRQFNDHVSGINIEPGQQDDFFTSRHLPVSSESETKSDRFSPCNKSRAILPACKKSLSIGQRHGMEQLHHQIKRAAMTDEPVLILGESGAGKSWIARQIHNQSSRKSSPFVSVNMSNLSPSLAESQLFGTEKGDFTDAVNRCGLFQEVKDGTLFLDEIGELPLEIQPKLLDVLENRTFKKLSGTRDLPFKGRLIYATNADLSELVREKKFRLDLFYRISVLVITVPPLRQRPDEIVSFATELAAQKHRTISPQAIDKLLSYSWPGNIRELQHVITRAAIFSDNQELQSQDIQFLGEDFFL